MWEYFSRGRTPGKMMLGLRVISLRGTGLNASHSIIRNMVRIGDMYPFIAQLGFFFIPSYFVAAFFILASSETWAESSSSSISLIGAALFEDLFSTTSLAES